MNGTRWKISALAALCLLVLAGCAAGEEPPAPRTALEELPAYCSPEQARADGWVLYEDGDITSGQEAWDAFVEQAEAGKAAEVRLAFHYTLGDPSRYSSALYAEIKDDYPKMFVQDLAFDGERYTLRWFETGEDGERTEYLRTYPYLVRSEGEPRGGSPSHIYYVRYLLSERADVTWEEVTGWMVSATHVEGSCATDQVYVDLIYPEEETG